jgi:hypothetical protein
MRMRRAYLLDMNFVAGKDAAASSHPVTLGLFRRHPPRM